MSRRGFHRRGTHFAMVIASMSIALAGCPNPAAGPDTGPAPAPSSAPNADVTISFADPENPDINLSPNVTHVLKGESFSAFVATQFSGYTWYLNGVQSAAIASSGSVATINTSSLGYGNHTVHVFVSEGYSASFTFDVVDRS